MMTAVRESAATAPRYFFKAAETNCPIKETGSMSAQRIRLRFKRERGRGHFLQRKTRLSVEHTT